MIRLLLLLSFLCSNIVAISQNEVTLYDKTGDAIAYIDTNDDWTIYMWDGRAVSYIVEERGVHEVYAFNGNHLGWYESGLIIDHNGNCVGFTKESNVNFIENSYRYKGLKQFKPMKLLMGLTPIKPLYTNRFSNESLSSFLEGAKNESLNYNYNYQENFERKIFKPKDPIMETDLDLMARTNIQKQALFDKRTQSINKILNETHYYISKLKENNYNEFIIRMNNLQKNINTISRSRIDYSKLDQFLTIYNPLVTELNNIILILNRGTK